MTEYLFEVRIEREPSCELMVFCRVMGTKEEPEEVEAREGVCSIETAMVRDQEDAGRWRPQGRGAGNFAIEAGRQRVECAL